MEPTLKEIQAVQLELLKECARLCDKHGLQYFLAQGTLIGAVRHQGFIPWDDDIDIIMPLRDLKQFVSIFQREASSDYFITNCKIEKSFPVTWTKVRKNNTASIPRKYRDLPIHWGICIDIFPCCNISSNVFIRAVEITCVKIARKLFLASMTKYEEKTSRMNRAIEKIPLTLRSIFGRFLLGVFSLQKKDTRDCYLFCKNGTIVPRAVLFDGRKSLPFEDGMFRVPAHYKEYLSSVFGDYMTPPPIEERCGHEQQLGEIIWDCKNSYETYKNSQ